MKLALMTGGGDAPGLNGIIESTCKCLLRDGYELVGVMDGFEGIFSERTRNLRLEDVEGIHSQAGSILGSSNRSATKGREAEFLEKFSKLGVQGMVVAGGDGTFAGLKAFEKEIRLIGVPKTIDNDLSGTDITFGYDTACSVVAEAIDALRATATTHRRMIFVETMGRTAGWIALGGGLASYADVILIPERPFDRAKLVEFVRKKHASGQRGLMIAVAEGAAAKNERPEVAFQVKGSPQTERYGGIAATLARWLEKEVDWEARHVVLGHLQRAEHPTTTDRFLTLSMGVEVAKMVEDQAWGQAVVYRQGRVERAPISALMGPARLVEPEHRWVHHAEALGLFI